MIRKEWGLYIHWPFCLSKCPYCDFNSHVRASVDEERWGRALLRELEEIFKIKEEGTLISLFFGGGTPSLMPPHWVKEIIDLACALGPTSPAVEITLEANPTSSEAKRFEAFADAGVNRLSLGVQAFDENSLRFLGRTHSGDQARQALIWASRLFPRFSFDLIYALPGQTLNSWKRTLAEALTFKPRHLSCYQLTYEPGTPFYSRFLRGDLAYPVEEDAIALYDVTEKILKAAGLEAYEVSNYAAVGQTCRHNLLYWRYQDYIGIGPGAHGRLTQKGKKIALQNRRTPEKWLEAVESRGQGIQESSLLEPLTLFQEWLLMGLRLKEGLDLTDCEAITGQSWKNWISEKTLSSLIQEGFMSLQENRLRVSSKGRLVLNQIVKKIGQEAEINRIGKITC